MKNISIHNLNESTSQEVFDFITKHLRTQNKPCVGTSGECLYRHENLMCAAGCLIPVEVYKLEFEGKSWQAIGGHFGCWKHEGLIRSLQVVHDNQRADCWEGHFEKIAGEYGLEMPAKVETFK